MTRPGPIFQLYPFYGGGNYLAALAQAGEPRPQRGITRLGLFFQPYPF